MKKFTNSIAKVLLNRPKTVTSLVLILSIFFCWQLKDFALSAGTNQLMLENDPDLEVYNNVREEFGTDEYVIVSFRFPDGTVFDPENTKLVNSLTSEISSLSSVEQVLSPTSVQLFQNKTINPIVLFYKQNKGADLFPTLGDSDCNIERAKKELLNHEIWSNNIISKGGKVVSILAYLKTDPEYIKTSSRLDQLRELLSMYQKRAEASSEQERSQMTKKITRKKNSLRQEIDEQRTEREEDIQKFRTELTALREQEDPPQKQIETLKRRIQQKRNYLKNQIRITNKNRHEIAALLDRLESREAEMAQTRTNRREKLVGHIRELRDKYEKKRDIQFRLSGLPVINLEILSFIASDMILFGIAVSIFVLIVLFLLFRKLRWVFLPTITSLLTVGIVVGAMAMLGYRISIVTSNITSLLFILGFAHSIHYLIRYREGLAIRTEMDDQKRHRWTFRGIIIPCVYTAATTAVGFISLLVADIQPVMVFGIFMSIGVLVAFLISFLFFPAALSLFPEPDSSYGLGRSKRNWFQQLARVCRQRNRLIYVLAILAFLFSIIGILQLKVEARFVDYFRSSTEISKGLTFIDRELGGTTPLEIVVDGNEKNYFKKKKNLEKIQKIRAYFEDVPEAGKVLALTQMQTEIQKIADFLNLPEIPPQKAFDFAEKFIPESFFRSYVTDDWSKVRIEVRMKETSSSLDRNEVLANFQSHLRDTEGLQDLKKDQVKVSGLFKLYTNMLNSLVGSQVKSFGLVVLLILGMLMLLFRSWRIALVGIVPNVLPIFVVLGMMGWTGIPLDIVTVMIASVSLGIAVDGTIHYTFRFREEVQKGKSIREAMNIAHGTVGQAISYTCVTIIAGFWVLILSKFLPTVYFGLLSGLAMLAAMFSTLTFLPILYQDLSVFDEQT